MVWFIFIGYTVMWVITAAICTVMMTEMRVVPYALGVFVGFFWPVALPIIAIMLIVKFLLVKFTNLPT